MLEYNAAIRKKQQDRKQECLSLKLIQELVSTYKIVDVQSTDNQFKKIEYEYIDAKERVTKASLGKNENKV